MDPNRPVLSTFREQERLSYPLCKKRVAARFLISLLKKIAPGADSHQVIKTKLAHGNKILVVDHNFFKLSQQEKIEASLGFDGMVTSVSDATLFLSGADCPPVAFFDPINGVIGLVHSGWRGTVARISSECVKMMQRNFGTEAKHLVVSVGPSIAKNEFEVGGDVFTAFKNNGYAEDDLKKYFWPISLQKWLLDLPLVIKDQVIEAGVLAKNIECSSFTTSGNSNVFASARVSGGVEKIDSNFFLLSLV
ncbi:MAG: polyphenol oxidase family protein [bacterium]